MTFDEALNLLSRDEAFKATVSAMNALLIRKGVYTHEEFEAYFIESAAAKIRKASPAANDGDLARHPEMA